MMNEFPPKYFEVVRESSGSGTAMTNASDYLEDLWASGVETDDLDVVQPLYHHRIWERMTPGDGPERLSDVIADLEAEHHAFHVDGASWTNDISWVRGYERLLLPMEKASAGFHQRVLSRRVPPDDGRYRNALFHLLTAETSCYRYWGEGVWTAYGAEIARRANDIIANDL